MALFQRIANAARRSATTKLTRGPRRKANRLKPRALLGVETLERREVMAGNLTAGLSPDLTIASTNPKFAPEAIAVQPSAARVNALVSGRTLLVEGTDRLDRIVVSQDGNTLAVGGVRILHNGRAVTTIDARLIDKVEVRGYGGDDVITMTTLDRPAEVWGGEGVDQIIGGRRGDTIHGGNMMDILWGGDGADAVHGDEGADRISGGAGADWLFGGAGVDELNGDEGADFLFGGDNFDILRGGAHGDWLEAGSIWEDVDGEGGRDWNAHVWAIDGATESDVDQESSGSCGFLSALAASSRWHDLSQNISYEGNFTYAVWLFDESIGQWTQERVRFDGSSRTMTDVNFDPKSVVEGEFWTIVYQRAYLQRYYGFDDSNWILTAWMTGETPARPMQAITGNAPWETATADWPADYFRQWLAAGPMTACDGEHCYAIADIFLDETGAWKVVLLNPWGVDGTHEGGLTWESEPATFTAGNDGYLTISWDVFAANLPYTFVTV